MNAALKGELQRFGAAGTQAAALVRRTGSIRQHERVPEKRLHPQISFRRDFDRNRKPPPEFLR
jgi:hypothetical protein